MWRLLTLTIALFGSFRCISGEYKESMLFRPLPEVSSVLGHAHFSIEEEQIGAQLPASDALFPKVLRQIMSKYDVETLRLSYSNGKYASSRFGASRTLDSTADANVPPGVRVQITFNPDQNASKRENLLSRWRSVTSELSGIFSTPLSRMDATVVIQPTSPSSPSELAAYAPWFSHETSFNSSHFLEGTLSREEVCTEKLTPWLKMLPCRTVTGFGAVLDPIHLVSSEYTALELFASHRDDGHIGAWALHQHLTFVQNEQALGDKVASAVDYSLGSILLGSKDDNSRQLQACPLSSQSLLYIETPYYPSRNHESTVHAVDMKQTPVDLWAKWQYVVSMAVDSIVTEDHLKRVQQRHSSDVQVHRFLSGVGQVDGGIAIRFENWDDLHAKKVTYHDTFAWYLRLYMHTFRSRLESLTAQESVDAQENFIKTFQFVPGEIRSRPNKLYLEMELPPRSVAVVSMQMDKVFLRSSEHPPDASRGFDVPAGVATFQNVDSSNGVVTMYTEPLLVLLPTPDFSMPYNVITMTSTVLAFAVGSMLNTLLRKDPRFKSMIGTTKDGTN